MYETEIQTKIQNLPEEIRSEAIDFIEFLTSKYQQKEIRGKKFKFDWGGGLSNIKEPRQTIGEFDEAKFHFDQGALEIQVTVFYN